MATCRGCGAAIRFVQIRSTKRWQPVDPEPSDFGNVVVEADGLGEVLSKAAAVHYTGEKFVPHWVFCPKAGEFRKGRT